MDRIPASLRAFPPEDAGDPAVGPPRDLLWTPPVAPWARIPPPGLVPSSPLARGVERRSGLRRPGSRRIIARMSERLPVRLRVNGERYERSVEPRLLLSDFLRHELGLTGTHVGCEHGVCGACTVLLDGAAVRSCLCFAVQASGREITTVEGLAPADGETLHPLQAAFREAHAVQCGFCTPGLLLTLVAFLEENPRPGRREIREAISGHLCRCTGYQKIVDAVELATRPEAS